MVPMVQPVQPEQPVLKAEWLHPGLHVTAMGSDQAGKNEIDPKALAAADLYACDRVSQCEKLGELRSAIAAGVWTHGSRPSWAKSSPAPDRAASPTTRSPSAT